MLIKFLKHTGAAGKGAHPIFFDLRALNHERIAVREKTTFFMP